MKRLSLLTLFITICYLQVDAQSVGIGTNNPDGSAILDVSGTNGGLLIPRLTTVQRDAITSPAKGLVVFNTTDNNFYCFDGAWKKLSAAADVWNLQGNSGTVPGPHFMGTNDAVPLIFGVNSLQRMKLNVDGRLELYNDYHGTVIGNGAGATLTIGPYNTFIGENASAATTTGGYSVAIGAGAAYNNIIGDHTGVYITDGIHNNFSGYNAGYNNTIGSFNLFSGSFAGANNTTGNFNISYGHSSGQANVTGNNNILIGAYADVTVDGLINAGAIGYNAKVSQSNSFVIGGTGAEAVRVGIGVTSPAYTLHVNGSVAGVGAYNNISDSRLKTNISPIDNALAGILQLQPVSYDWKKETYPQFHFDDKRQIGFLAQELEKIFPEAVTLGADGFYTIAYSQLIPVMVQGIKEQQQQIEILKSENIQLKKAFELLSKEIEAIKKQK